MRMPATRSNLTLIHQRRAVRREVLPRLREAGRQKEGAGSGKTRPLSEAALGVLIDWLKFLGIVLLFALAFVGLDQVIGWIARGTP